MENSNDSSNNETLSENSTPVRFSRHIVPFSFSGDYSRILSEIKNRQYKDESDECGYNWNHQTLLGAEGESDLLENIRKSFGPADEPGTLGAVFFLQRYKNSKKRQKYKKEFFLVYKERPSKKVVSRKIVLSGFRLILFRTGVGFLTYNLEIVPPEDGELKMADLQNIQYELKHTAHKNYSENSPDIEYLASLTRKEYLNSLGSLGSWIKRFLSVNICENIGFFPNHKDNDEIIPHKVLCFTYLLYPKIDGVDSPEDTEQHKNGVRLILGMRDSYDIVDGIDKIMPFNNVFWYAAYEASGVIAYYDKTNESYFCSGGFDKSVGHDYFYLYILALYQYHSTIKFFSELSIKLPADYSDYLNQKEDANQNPEDTNQNTAELLEEFENKINVFLLKSSFSSVSYTNQQNDYYNFCKKQLRIEENIKSLSNGLTPLAKMQRIHKDKLQEERDKRQDDKVNILSIAFAFFSVASVLSDGFAFFGTVDANNEWDNQMITRKWVGFGVAIAIIVVAAVWFISPLLKKPRRSKRAARNAGQSQAARNAGQAQAETNAEQSPPEQTTIHQ